MSLVRIVIAPSILSADFGRLAEEVGAVTASGADYVHVDVMDGRFVPNLTVGPPVVAALRRATTAPLDVHLMIVEPERYLADFAQAGADLISVHVEACPHLARTLQQIHELGKKAAVALNPATPLCSIDQVLADVEMVVVMTVNPGFGGQRLMTGALSKIRELRARIERDHLQCDIEVDGGVKVDNVAQVAEAGANVIVSGSGVFATGDYRATISALRARATQALGAARGAV